MKLLPHSNGVRKVDMRKKLNPKEVIKNVLSIIMIILIVGFVYQRISNFIAKETLRQRVDYARVDDKRLDYITDGEGKYTVVFDGNIGTNLNQWTKITDELTSEYDDITTFVYNRRGYGFSDGGSIRTLKEQAEDLRALLRKAAISSPYILVGEEYGSLVLIEFAKAYPDLVAGIVLVNPLTENIVTSKNLKKSLSFERFRTCIERLGAEVGFTTLLDKLNLARSTDEFENMLDERELNEFKVHRTKANYNRAVNNEYKNIISGLDYSKEEGIFSGKPYYLIAKPEQEVLAALGDDDLTKVYSVNYENNILAMYHPDIVIAGIRQVIKQANEIERLEKKNN